MKSDTKINCLSLALHAEILEHLPLEGDSREFREAQ